MVVKCVKLSWTLFIYYDFDLDMFLRCFMRFTQLIAHLLDSLPCVIWSQVYWSSTKYGVPCMVLLPAHHTIVITPHYLHAIIALLSPNHVFLCITLYLAAKDRTASKNSSTDGWEQFVWFHRRITQIPKANKHSGESTYSWQPGQSAERQVCMHTSLKYRMLYVI